MRAHGQLRPEATSTQRHHLLTTLKGQPEEGVAGGARRGAAETGERTRLLAPPRGGFKPGKEQLLCSRIRAKSAREVSLAHSSCASLRGRGAKMRNSTCAKVRTRSFVTCNPNQSPGVTCGAHKEPILSHKHPMCLRATLSWPPMAQKQMHAHTNDL